MRVVSGFRVHHDKPLREGAQGGEGMLMMLEGSGVKAPASTS